MFSNDETPVRLGKHSSYYYYMHEILNYLDALMVGENFSKQGSIYYKNHKEKIQQQFKKIPRITTYLGQDFFTEEFDNMPLEKKWHCYQILHTFYPLHTFIKGRFKQLKPLMEFLQNARGAQNENFALSASHYLGIIHGFSRLKKERCVNDDDFSQIYYELGKLQLAWGNYEEAEKNCQEASILYTGENEAPHILMVLGDIDLKKKNYEKAHKRFQTLSEIEENSEDLDKFRYVY